MDLRTLFLSIIISLFSLFGNAQIDLEWAHVINGANYDYGYLLEVDNNENVWSSGYAVKPLLFPPGINPPAGVGGGADPHLISYDRFGSFRNGFLVGSHGFDAANAMCKDDSNNIYITGIFANNTIDFDPGPGVYSPPLPRSSDCFIAKYDNNGQFIWARWIGTNVGGFDNQEDGRGIGVDSLGNVYITGSFQQTVDFDPGPGVYNMTPATLYSDIFLMSLDVNGNFRWAKQIGGLSGVITVEDLELDANGDIYVCGELTSDVDFDTGPGVYVLTHPNRRAYIAKYDNLGNFIWGTLQPAGTQYLYQIDINENGRMIAAGMFGGDIYFARIDPSTGIVIWYRRVTGPGLKGAFCVDQDSLNNIYVGGFFRNAIDIDPGPGSFTITSVGNWDAFFAKYQPNTSFEYAFSFGGISIDQLYDIEVTSPDEIWVTGIIDTEANVDPNGTYILVDNLPAYAIFIAKYTASIILPIELLDFYGESIGEENLLFWSTATELNNQGFKIERSSHGLVWEEIGYVNGIGNSQNQINYSWIDESPINGLNYYRLVQIDFGGIETKSNIIQIEKNHSKMKAVPNPFERHFSIVFPAPRKKVEIQVYNHMGMMFINEEHFNTDRITINGRGWSSGAYLVIVRTENSVKKTQIVKL